MIATRKQGAKGIGLNMVTSSTNNRRVICADTKREIIPLRYVIWTVGSGELDRSFISILIYMYQQTMLTGGPICR